MSYFSVLLEVNSFQFQKLVGAHCHCKGWLVFMIRLVVCQPLAFQFLAFLHRSPSSNTTLDRVQLRAHGVCAFGIIVAALPCSGLTLCSLFSQFDVSTPRLFTVLCSMRSPYSMLLVTLPV
jgi:hypothetical protein